MKNAVGNNSFIKVLPCLQMFTLPMKWIETLNYELASPTGRLASLK